MRCQNELNQGEAEIRDRVLFGSHLHAAGFELRDPVFPAYQEENVALPDDLLGRGHEVSLVVAPHRHNRNPETLAQCGCAQGAANEARLGQYSRLPQPLPHFIETLQLVAGATSQHLFGPRPPRRHQAMPKERQVRDPQHGDESARRSKGQDIQSALGRIGDGKQLAQNEVCRCEVGSHASQGSAECDRDQQPAGPDMILTGCLDGAGQK